MDATFFETQILLLTSNSSRGEYNGDEEFSVSLPILSTSTNVDSKIDFIDVEVQEANNELSSIDDKLDETPMKELRVYSRRQKSKNTPKAPEQSSEPDSGNSTPILSIPTINDIDLPIAQCKRVRSCTHHPTSNFLSYQHISPVFRSFLSKLSSMPIPQTFLEALGDPKWKEAMQEEMRNTYSIKALKWQDQGMEYFFLNGNTYSIFLKKQEC